jgi:Transposase IS66 family
MSISPEEVVTLRWKAGRMGDEHVEDDVHERGEHVPVVHADATDFMQGNADGEYEAERQMWLWAAVTSGAVVRHMTFARGATAARRPLERAFVGIVISNWWEDDNWLATWRRQLSWTHFMRDSVKIAERRGGETERWGAFRHVKTPPYMHALRGEWRPAMVGG